MGEHLKAAIKDLTPADNAFIFFRVYFTDHDDCGRQYDGIVLVFFRSSKEDAKINKLRMRHSTTIGAVKSTLHHDVYLEIESQADLTWDVVRSAVLAKKK